MGILLDADVIPITYRLFKDNTHDSQTMMPIMQKIRKLSLTLNVTIKTMRLELQKATSKADLFKFL